MEHLYIERHDDQQLIKLKRNGRTIAGITVRGAVVTMDNATKDITDDEWLELLRIPNTFNYPTPPTESGGDR